MRKIKNTIWITGMSASGKTTIASLLVTHYRTQNIPVVWLDGDKLRQALRAEKIVKKEQRLALAFQYSGLAEMFMDQGFLVIISAVALHKEIHIWNRNQLPGYYEVFIHCSLAELKRRDPKGLYASYYKGQTTNISGLDITADFPENPDFLIESDKHTNPETSLQALIEAFEQSLNDKKPRI